MGHTGSWEPRAVERGTAPRKDGRKGLKSLTGNSPSPWPQAGLPGLSTDEAGHSSWRRGTSGGLQRPSPHGRPPEGQGSPSRPCSLAIWKGSPCRTWRQSPGVRPRDPQGLQMSKESGSQRLAPEEENRRGGQQLWAGRLGLVPTWGLQSTLCHPHLARDGGPLWPHMGPGPRPALSTQGPATAVWWGLLRPDPRSGACGLGVSKFITFYSTISPVLIAASRGRTARL